MSFGDEVRELEAPPPGSWREEAPPTEPTPVRDVLRALNLPALDPVRAAAVAVQLGALLQWLSDADRTIKVWKCGVWCVELRDTVTDKSFQSQKRDALDAVAHALVQAQAAELDDVALSEGKLAE